MKRRVVTILVGSALATLTGLQPLRAEISIPIELRFLNFSSTQSVDAPLGPNYTRLKMEMDMDAVTDGSLAFGSRIIDADLADVANILNGTPLSFDELMDVPMQIVLTDVDPSIDFSPVLPRDPLDPNKVILNSFFFFDNLVGSSAPVDLSRVNFGFNAAVDARLLDQVSATDVGDLNGDLINDLLSLTTSTISTSLVSEGLLLDGRHESVYDISGDLVWNINPTFTVNIAGTFAIAEEIIIPASAVPVPAAVWLFGSGLMGLLGISRRKKL